MKNIKKIIGILFLTGIFVVTNTCEAQTIINDTILEGKYKEKPADIEGYKIVPVIDFICVKKGKKPKECIDYYVYILVVKEDE